MNEQLKELAESANIVFGTDKNGDPEVICSVGDIERFAELLIDECIDYAADEGDQVWYLAKLFGFK
jgi:hypothetical protein